MSFDYVAFKEHSIKLLEERGVTLTDIAKVTLELQSKYFTDLTLEECVQNVSMVVGKREVINTILTGIALDKLTEQGLIEEPLSTILSSDYSLYGIDEVFAYSIVNIYGSIGLTNFGYVDKVKLGIIGELDKAGKDGERCNTFLDDIVGAIAAAAASRIAHSKV